ncbi:MAG: DUF6384 family protein [Bythopirellula sp.]|nr:DUF6384 family protein [Bythopirellula sp.]
MAKVQYAQQEAPAAESTEVPRVARPEQLSLPELIRIMDVATELRKGQEVVEEQLNLDQIKVRLRERLLEAAQVAGESVTAEQIDAAIDDYYDKLHSFEEPKWSVHVLLAHLYVQRVTIIKWVIGIGALVGMYWGWG